MTHFAKVNNGLVVHVMVAEPEFFETFIDTSPGVWLQTSYNTLGGVHYVPGSNYSVPSEDQSKALRKNYASIGYSYNAELDAFIPPKPFASWIFNAETCLWDAPLPFPNDGLPYRWDEANLQWQAV
jgi:hypothetical protein